MGLGAGHAQQFKEFTIKCSDGVERPYVIYDRDQGAGNREQGTGSREQGAGSREQGAKARSERREVRRSLCWYSCTGRYRLLR